MTTTWRDWRIIRRLGAGGAATVDLVERAGMVAVLKRWGAHVGVAERQIECRNLYLAAALGVSPAPIETTPDGVVMAYEPAPTGLAEHARIRAFLGAINRLHTRGFVHRDLKPENVIGVKLIDLGCMVDMFRDRDLPPIGTPGYAAPEAYQGVISPLIDAYGAGWVIASWLGGPDPDPRIFGPPQGWTPPTEWQWLIQGLLAPQPERRLSVGQAYAALTGPWVTLPGGAQIASDLVTVDQWRATIPDAPYREMYGYATDLAPSDVARYLRATGARLPTLAELIDAARGTELAVAARSPTTALLHAPVSDWGARHMRRLLWQPTSDGWLFGGACYADQDRMPAPTESNPMIGLRPARDAARP